jgi:predicted nucleic acid-binding protein
MSSYVDTSALLKRYLDEADSPTFVGHLDADPAWVTARVTYVEARRNLAARLAGDDLVTARARFERDWSTIDVVEIDRRLCALAAEFVEEHAVRSLDAIHLAAYARVRDDDFALVTADQRQTTVARELGWTVLDA